MCRLSAVLMQAAWACVLAASGTYDQLTDYVIFAAWIFYGLVTSAVIVLRFRAPDLPRPYRTLGYPVVPLVFVLVAIWLVVNTLVNRPVESVAGLVLSCSGCRCTGISASHRARTLIPPSVFRFPSEPDPSHRSHQTNRVDSRRRCRGAALRCAGLRHGARVPQPTFRTSPTIVRTRTGGSSQLSFRRCKTAALRLAIGVALALRVPPA